MPCIKMYFFHSVIKARQTTPHYQMNFYSYFNLRFRTPIPNLHLINHYFTHQINLQLSNSKYYFQKAHCLYFITIIVAVMTLEQKYYQNMNFSLFQKMIYFKTPIINLIINLMALGQIILLKLYSIKRVRKYSNVCYYQIHC